MSPSVSAQSDNVETLAQQLRVEPPKKQLQVLQALIEAGELGQQTVFEFLLERKKVKPTYVEGWAFCLLHQIKVDSITQGLQTHWPTGLVEPISTCKIDYLLLQTHLISQDFKVADRLTLEKLCELAGPAAIKRKWIYFTEVESFPIEDLRTLNTLWSVYSQGKFGFSAQRELWLGVGQNWDLLWEKIAWKRGNLWTRYPGEFIWNLSAPLGHLPLSNQLRGVRVMAALMNHPAWIA